MADNYIDLPINDSISIDHLDVFDPDAQTFFDSVEDAGGSLTVTEKNAINDLVLTLKTDNIFNKFFVMYPMVGGSAASCSINLGQLGPNYNLLFFGSPTVTNTGVQWNGVNQYASTQLYLSSVLSGSSGPFGGNGGMSYYSRTNVAEASFDMGSSTTGGGGQATGLILRNGVDTTYYLYGTDSYSVTAASTDSRGMFSINREGFQTVGYKNGTQVDSQPDFPTVGFVTATIGAFDFGGNVASFSTKECAFACINQTLTPTEMADFYTAVQTFQTTLGRQV